MKRIFLITVIVMMLSFTTSCKADTFDMYKDEMSELLRDPKTRTLKGDENDVGNLDGCQIRFELEGWQLSEYGNKRVGNTRYVWDRGSSWFDGKIISSGGDAIDFNHQKNSAFFSKQNSFYFVYIGPWQKITLTHNEGSFFNSKEIKKQKTIRFFAYYPKEGGEIKYQYESMTEENKSIPEKQFSLSATAKYAPDKFGLCVVKWTAKFGYNAVAEVKSKNPFSKNYLVPTGRVINTWEE